MIVRVEKNHNYTVMSNYHLRDDRLSLKSKGLLSMILSLPDDWNYSKNGLLSLCKEKEDTINTIIKELKEYGYLKIIKRKNYLGKFVYEYIIYEIPEGEKQYMDDNFAIGGKTRGGKAKSGKTPSILNTNILNTNILNTNNFINKEDLDYINNYL